MEVLNKEDLLLLVISNGLLIQWGSIISDATWQLITLPRSYTNTLYKVVVGISAYGQYGATAIPTVQRDNPNLPITVSSFHLGLYGGTSAQSQIYLTIGY